LHIKEILPNCKITALDCSEQMTNKSMNFNAAFFNNEVAILREDFLNNSLQNNAYDIIVCAFGLKHFNHEQTKLIALEVQRILKPNGQFIFIEISIPSKSIIQKLFSLHFQFILPFIAKLFSHNHGDYKLLWHYLQNFQNCKNAHEMFAAIGLHNNYKKHLFGMTTSIQGIKY
jgi:demethylmenaquinone methyltransferase/2-methoxy-6-polyprenyl-1,4-benzoquinol methylase